MNTVSNLDRAVTEHALEKAHCQQRRAQALFEQLCAIAVLVGKYHAEARLHDDALLAEAMDAIGRVIEGGDPE